jgi:Ca2+-binding EF-hand superfamily protein
LKDRLEDVISVAWHRQQRADRAFSLLDVAGKGVVIVEDMQRAAREVMLGDEKVTDEDVEEMMQEVDQSGDGLLTKEDFYRLAIKINL